jgi:hypothetical protein
MSRSRAIVVAVAIGLIAPIPAAQAARADTGWVKFDMRRDKGTTYVYPRLSNGSWSHVFAGNCQFNGLVLTDAEGKHLYDMLLTAQEQGLRVNLGYDDTDGPVCRLAHLHIEWAD